MDLLEIGIVRANRRLVNTHRPGAQYEAPSVPNEPHLGDLILLATTLTDEQAPLLFEGAALKPGHPRVAA